MQASRVNQTAADGLNGDDPRNRSVPELLGDLAGETTTLVRQELDLFKAEMLQKGKETVAAVTMFAVAAFIGLGAFGALTACFIAALASAMPVWLAALIVAAVYTAVAAVAALMGKSRLQKGTPLTPDQTIQTLKEDVQWTKTQAKSGTT